MACQNHWITWCWSWYPVNTTQQFVRAVIQTSSPCIFKFIIYRAFKSEFFSPTTLVHVSTCIMQVLYWKKNLTYQMQFSLWRLASASYFQPRTWSILCVLSPVLHVYLHSPCYHQLQLPGIKHRDQSAVYHLQKTMQVTTKHWSKVVLASQTGWNKMG